MTYFIYIHLQWKYELIDFICMIIARERHDDSHVSLDPCVRIHKNWRRNRHLPPQMLDLNRIPM